MGETESRRDAVRDDFVTSDPWRALRRFTAARIALGRAGHALPTRELLDFQLAHARARDAVHLPFEAEALGDELRRDGFDVLCVDSAAGTREVYLRRPDLGRRLDPASRKLLEGRASPGGCDAAFVLADGLSPLAVHRNAGALLRAAAGRLSGLGWRIAPVVVARQGRVALGDEIGALLRSELVAVLFGERPGLSAADSLGIYLTYGPRPGRTDAERNCISNVRPEGLGYEEAADALVYLMTEARRRRLTGIALKDERLQGPALSEERTARSSSAGKTPVQRGALRDR
ncbi:MAG: ethanolamine ammonia-lyase subunit EutC [Deltaproteobacteria bacterium]|nr:ethanolamine ammonia-lyase subunit EutC [Deltaproteobacteria bacterium]